MEYFLLILLPVIIFAVNFIFKIKNLIPNYSGEKHQRFVGANNIPLSGGFFLILFTIFIFYNNFSLFSVFIFLIFILGLASDINIISSPRLRFILQAALIFCFVYFSNLHIESTRIYFLDFFLNNILLSYLFTVFCLMIVINGTNFIDGLNGLVLGYYLMISIIIFKFGFFIDLNISENQMIFFIILLSFLFLFNISNQLYLGDSGAYLLSFILGIFLISIYQKSQNVSPFFIILLLWYPCFENLFSIIRKFRFKRSPIYPDNNHFHQLLFYFIKIKLKYKNQFSNNLSSLIIIFYNMVIFLFSCVDITNTQYQMALISINIIFYIFFYIRLMSFKYNLKNK